MAVTQNLTLTQLSQSQTGNSSQVRILWTSTQTGGSYNLTPRTAYLYVTVNGQTESTLQVSYTLPLQTTQTILDTVLTVPHREDGTADIKVRTWMNTNISAGVVTKTATLTPDPIARQSRAVASPGVIGQRVQVLVERKNPAYTHSILCTFGELSGYLTGAGELSQTPQRLTATAIAFAIPESFYSQLPDAPEAPCRLQCTTYQGSTVIGQPVTTEFSVRAEEDRCRPLVTGQTVDKNPVTLAVTGDERVLIRYLSDAQVNMTAIARQGATVTSLSVDGQKAEAGTLHLPGITTPPVQYEVTDSRGFTGTSPWEGDWIPYVRLTSQPTAQRTDLAGGKVRLQFSGMCYAGSLNPYIAVPNTLTLSCSVNGGDFIPVTAYTVETGRYSAEMELSGLAYDRIHSLTVRVSDRLMTVDKVLTVKKSTPVFDWGEQDFHFRVPVRMDSSLQVGSLTVGEKSLLDLVYPVGSVYISMTATSPQELFGGSWQQLKDRFLLAAGEYPAGSTGGEKEHTLTVAEMPAHSHTVSGRVNGEAGGGDGAWDYSGNWPKEANGATAATGGGEAHNNMPPYLAVYMWQRIA